MLRALLLYDSGLASFPTRDGQPPVLLALASATILGSSQTIEILTELVDAGAQIDTKDKRNSTAWHEFAASSDSVSARLGQWLQTKLGTRCISDYDSEGETPLHIATSTGKGREATRILLQTGADPTKRTQFQGSSTPNVIGDTPLHYAAHSGDARRKQ